MIQKLINLVPIKLQPYFRLMRLHSPAGSFLLIWPGLWSLALASESLPNIWLLLLFILGSFIMRSAGCIINDIADRKIDTKVKRTKNRPLASKELSIKQAFFALGILLFMAFMILLTMNKLTIIIGLLSIIPISIYPFMKRFTYWPQIFLGLTFNLGAIMGWTAIKGTLDFPAISLYIGCIFWTIGYDTIYAYQDIEDDYKAGVKSTAMILNKSPHKWLRFFYLTFAMMILIAGATSKINFTFYIALLPTLYHLYWQVDNVDLNSPIDCFKKFSSNNTLGILLFTDLLIAKM